tara:strand:- start:1215 stop:1658 length:444 start_codon:yes stop_codon:yes gene_type:complete
MKAVGNFTHNTGAKSMADNYDNANKGAAFPPFPTQSLILQGKINVQGSDEKLVLVKDQTRDGKPIIEVYQKVGVLFVNDKKQTENAPDYSGPYLNDMRMAAWKRMKDDKPYMTFAVDQKRTDFNKDQAAAFLLDRENIDLQNDDVPF